LSHMRTQHSFKSQRASRAPYYVQRGVKNNTSSEDRDPKTQACLVLPWAAFAQMGLWPVAPHCPSKRSWRGKPIRRPQVHHSVFRANVSNAIVEPPRPFPDLPQCEVPSRALRASDSDLCGGRVLPCMDCPYGSWHHRHFDHEVVPYQNAISFHFSSKTPRRL